MLLAVALQAGLSLGPFAFMQAVTLATFGISELQNLKTSPMQAARCSGVPWANPADDDEARRVAATAVATRAVRSFVMSVSFCVRWLAVGSR